MGPLGDDLTVASPPERHVRFASPAAEHRAMTASGASMNTTEDDIMRGTNILVCIEFFSPSSFSCNGLKWSYKTDVLLTGGQSTSS